MSRNLTGCMLSVMAVTIAVVGGVPSDLRAAELSAVHIGRAPPRDAPPLADASFEGAEPLYLVIDTPYEMWSQAGSYVHTVVYGADFKPRSGARVYANQQLVGYTDSRGVLVFRNVPAPEGEDGREDGAYVVITAIHESGGKRAAGLVAFEAHQRSPQFESNQIYVYTDRGIYAPGETIRVRAIAWQLRGDYKPIADGQLELQLLTSEGRLAGGGTFFTGSYGTGAFELPLPHDMPLGTYTMAVIFAGGRGTTELRVTRAEPPAIEIKHDLRRYLAMGGEALTFTVQLASFVGAPIRGGKLEVRVRHGGRTFFEESRAIDGSDAYAFTVDQQTLGDLEKQTGDGGRFDVVVWARDDAGRSAEHRREITLSQNPYRGVLEADKDHYVPGETAKLQLKLVDLDETPVGKRGARVEISAGNAPRPTKTDALGIASFEVVVASEPITVRAFVDDVETPIASHTIDVIDDKAMLSKIDTTLVKERRRVPIEVRIADGYTPTERYVHGDVVDSSGALIAAFLLPLSQRGGGWVAKGSFTAPAWGTMLITLFCAAQHGIGAPGPDNVGLLTEGQQITVVPDKGLNVTLSGIPSSARAGQRIRVSGRVQDSRGRSKSSSVGVSVVDSAVVSMLDPLETTPQQHFYNPQLKVLASTGAKILTWPVVSRNWSIERQDIALPPFGFREGHPGGDEEGGTTPAPTLSLDDEGAGGLLGAAAPARARRRGAVGTPSVAPVTQISIERSFPETTLWIEDLEARGGRFAFELTVPNRPTRHTLSVVASDDAGGAGTARVEIPVVGDLTVRADVPSTMRLGDRVQIRVSANNHRDKPISGDLKLSAEHFDVADGNGPLELAAHASVTRTFDVTAKRSGLLTIEASATVNGKPVSDVRNVRVMPAGGATAAIHSSPLTAGTPHLIEIDTDAATTAHVGVVVEGPGRVVDAYLSLLSDADDSSFAAMPGAASALAFHIATYLTGYEAISEDNALRIRDTLARDLARVTTAHDGSGGMRFFRRGQPSPYLSGRALEGLTAARKVQFPVSEQLMGLFGAVILDALDKKSIVQVDDPVYWQGERSERQLALTAYLFRMLAEAGQDAVPMERIGDFERMRERVARFRNLTNDPLTIANAGMGLLAYEENFMGSKLDARTARRYMRRIMEAYADSHWEPTWFNSRTGAIETTAAAMELVQVFDPQRAETLARDVGNYLLTQQAQLAGWRDCAAAIATVRALTALPLVPPSATPPTVKILVNQEPALEMKLDTKAPFAGALPLNDVDLTAHLKAGKNQIEITYEGDGAAFVKLDSRRYSRQSQGVDIVANRFIDQTTLQPGGVAEVKLRLNAPSPVSLLAIEEPLPANLVVDIASLDALVAGGRISAYRVGEHVTFFLPKLEGNAVLSYKLIGAREGEASMGPTLVRPLQQPQRTAASGESSRFTVK